MEKSEIKTMMKETLQEEIVPVFVNMLRASEDRIDATNKMIHTLAEASDKYTVMYRTHIASVVESRNVSQKNESELIKANIDLTHLIQSQKEEYLHMLASYREELHSAKAKIEAKDATIEDLRKRCDRLQEKYDKLHETYDKLLEKYEILAERSLDKTGPGSRADVKVNL